MQPASGPRFVVSSSCPQFPSFPTTMALPSEETSAPLCITESLQPHATLPSVNSYKERGNYHLARKEIDLAIEAYTHALEEAEAQNNPVELAHSLKNIGRAYLEKEEWPKAAKILNSALVLFENAEEEKAKQVVLSLMVELERRFLQKVCGVGKIPLNLSSENYLLRREHLKIMRRSIKIPLKFHVPPKKILEDFSQLIGGFLEVMFIEMYPILGKPPCDFTVISLGSLGRKEMSPFSDLEFALLIKRSSHKNIDYFRKMVKWLEIQVIYFGETEIKILERGNLSPVRRGFSFDDGGNTPLGKQGYVELIKTKGDG